MVSLASCSGDLVPLSIARVLLFCLGLRSPASCFPSYNRDETSENVTMHVRGMDQEVLRTKRVIDGKR